MNSDARLKMLEGKLCPYCGKRIQAVPSKGELSVDITTLSVEQKRKLYAALQADKFPDPIDLAKFVLLPVEEKMDRLSTPPREAW
jgi:hypothetical protein